MPEDKVIIFDTTLRDGEQAAGAAMTLEEKVEIAKQLERLRVDVIEAGFAASSPGDFWPSRPSQERSGRQPSAPCPDASQRTWTARRRRSKTPPTLAYTSSCPARTSR